MLSNQQGGIAPASSGSPFWAKGVGAVALFGTEVCLAFLQFQKDAKDAQELLRKVDTDLDQKYSPDFKDRYQIESLLRELDVSNQCKKQGMVGSIAHMLIRAETLMASELVLPRKLLAD